MNDAKIRVPLLNAINTSRAAAQMQPILCISFVEGNYVQCGERTRLNPKP